VLSFREEAEEVDMLELSCECEVDNKEGNEVHGDVEEDEIYDFEKRILDVGCSPLVFIQAVINVLSMKIEHFQDHLLEIHI
jgi:hypothetical protein